MALTKVIGDGTGTLNSLTFGDSHSIGNQTTSDNLQIKSSSGENIVYDSLNGAHIFYKNGTENFRVNDDGEVRITDNILLTASGKGIYLGVTSATAANLLDDYEEGSHNITFTNSSLSPTSQGAVYTKIGNVVNYVGSLGFPSTSDSTDINISLPFASASNNGIGVLFTNGITNKILFTGGSGQTYMRVYPDNSFSQNSYADLSGYAMYFTITYQAT